jgi:hypothetical protein
VAHPRPSSGAAPHRGASIRLMSTPRCTADQGRRRCGPVVANRQCVPPARAPRGWCGRPRFGTGRCRHLVRPRAHARVHAGRAGPTGFERDHVVLPGRRPCRCVEPPSTGARGTLGEGVGDTAVGRSLRNGSHPARLGAGAGPIRSLTLQLFTPVVIMLPMLTRRGSRPARSTTSQESP